jgi:hypothetical protein
MTQKYYKYRDGLWFKKMHEKVIDNRFKAKQKEENCNETRIQHRIKK